MKKNEREVNEADSKGVIFIFLSFFRLILIENVKNRFKLKINETIIIFVKIDKN